MRLLTLALFTVIASSAFADELIDIPTARKITFEDVRYEFRAQPDLRGNNQQFLGIGVGTSFELDLKDTHTTKLAPVGSFDVAYNILTAFPGLAPGFAVGIQDAPNLTPDGRRFYLVTTFRNEMDDLPGNLYTDVSLGIQTGSITSPFVGISMPFSKTLYLVAEDSGLRVSGGFELRPAPRVNLRFVVRDNQPLISLSASGKF